MLCFLSTLTSFFFTYPSTTQIYTLSLHDALPISCDELADMFDWRKMLVIIIQSVVGVRVRGDDSTGTGILNGLTDRKSTRLNSSHRCISYAVFCLKKKKKST